MWENAANQVASVDEPAAVSHDRMLSIVTVSVMLILQP